MEEEDQKEKGNERKETRDKHPVMGAAGKENMREVDKISRQRRRRRRDNISGDREQRPKWGNDFQKWDKEEMKKHTVRTKASEGREGKVLGGG